MTIFPLAECLIKSWSAEPSPSASTKPNGQTANSAPAPLAIPIPPRDPAKIDQQWPITTHAAATIGAASVPPKLAASHTAKYPLPISATNTIMPGIQPAARIVLVAPAWPEPEPRTSTPAFARVTNMAKGMDPSRYAMTAKAIVFSTGSMISIILGLVRLSHRMNDQPHGHHSNGSCGS